jgi:hypothetical protein
MSYDTWVDGSFRITPALNEAETQYLQDFAATRHALKAGGPYAVDCDTAADTAGGSAAGPAAPAGACGDWSGGWVYLLKRAPPDGRLAARR